MSAVASYSDLYAAIVGRLPATPKAEILLQACQWSVRDFLKATLAWCEKLTAINVTAGDDTYDLSPAVDATYDVHQIVIVWLRTAADVTAGDDGAVQDLSLCEFDPSTNILTLPAEPSVSVTNGLVVQVVKLPHYNATSVAAWVIKRYFDAFVHGAVQYLAKQRNRPWFDLDVAKDAANQLSMEKARAATDRLAEFRSVIPITGSSPCAFIGS